MHDHDHAPAAIAELPPPEDAPILTLLGYLVRAWWRSSRWHWTTVRDTGITVYQRNGRGERRVQQRPGGYQPIDRHWLATGEWAPRPRAPIGQSSRAMWANISAARTVVVESGTLRASVPTRPFLFGVPGRAVDDPPPPSPRDRWM